MAKISPVSTKYMIYAEFEATGRVEKPDVVGALFGQTEGLLGKNLELRELQKEGKVGRIKVEVESKKSKTTGKINVPSSLNKTETTLVAAAIETIEKIGPSEAKVNVKKIEDVRKNKRDYILKRAESLLESIEQEMPRAKEMTRDLKTKSRESKLTKYGKEKLPAGDLSGDEIIVVEGRADVLNLLRCGVDNVIAMDGTKLPEGIKKLSKEKKAVLFVDGDRGGKLIARNAIDNADIDQVVFAPDGKEVEELSYKEIHTSLRKRTSAQDFLGKKSRKKSKSKGEKEINKNKEELKKKLKKVEDTKKALFLDNQLKVISKVSTRGAFSKLKKLGSKVNTVIVDIATKGIIKAAEKNNVENIIANNFAFSSEKVNMISL
jgi:DNA primase